MTNARTSQSHPLQIAEVRASPDHGRIGITFCPGKHDALASTGAWARDLATDLEAIADWGAHLVLTLVEEDELDLLKVPNLGAEVEKLGMAWRHLPIRDYSVPTDAFEAAWQSTGRELRDLLRGGGNVVVHCRGGLGRAGMIAARLLAELGVEPAQAIRDVRAARPGAIETPAQLALVRRTGPVTDDVPLDMAALEKAGPGMGSNPGGVYRDGAGRQYYVKELESPAHARNERIAARLYHLAGAPTLRYVATVDPCLVATEFVTLEKRCIARFSEDERRQAQRWLGVHAWTANWDAVGFDGDNQGVAGGVVMTLDTGGALAFRASGDPKGKAFGESVGELDRLRTDPDNPHAVRLFGDMSVEQVADAVAVVTRLPDGEVRRVVQTLGGSAKLAAKMIARKADMARRSG
ncbi:hypothetical protein RGUI_1805 [Rhodovulum sp. P5]|uniref:cyclin-dependent kinase inhibitor 3 family protein n=1 Tax=Rhodovulum sp. P5 TaxID=1564506 RepID=UPI0009C24907|nr:cyclin-dependent kinase inhibitor 3 family protein [Rhodovulum sp. P5]ARE39946.1 hypothetical protein RGUI_1805 [Rhodovulum sp. P5]